MIDDLIELQERFQPYLLDNDFTFIGPTDTQFLERFMKRANDLAPVVGLARRLRDFLGNREATSGALNVLPEGSPLRIYVVIGNVDDNLFHDTIEHYCITNGIDFH